MALDVSDRTLFRLTWLALNISLASGLLLVFAQSGGTELGTALALAFTVLFYFVSFPFHGCLTAACIVRCVRRGASNMGWVWAYLLAAVLGHTAVAAHLQGFKSVEHDVTAARAVLVASANRDGAPASKPLRHLVLAASQGHLELADALRDSGADPNRRPQGDDPIDLQSCQRKNRGDEACTDN